MIEPDSLGKARGLGVIKSTILSSKAARQCIKGWPSDPAARVVAPIVEGQVRSFINDHPEMITPSKSFFHSQRGSSTTCCVRKTVRGSMRLWMRHWGRKATARVRLELRAQRATLVCLWRRP